jgi:hypothetical protein
MSYSIAHADGRLPICKQCISEIAGEDYKDIQTALRMVDRPWLPHLWKSALEDKRETLGAYFVLINAKDFRHMTWADSELDTTTNKQHSQVKNAHANTSSYNKDDFQFKVTNEMIMRWGSNYEVDDYAKLEDFYHKMKMSNRIETPQDETYLKKLAVISLKMDQELEAGNYNQVKQLGDLFSKYMADSKFRAMDKTEADKTGGIRNFGAIFAEVEKDGHIPPWEQYRKIKGLTQDIVDKTIMHIENFTLRLNKIERMTEPPVDTPKLTSEDTDMLDGGN